MRWRGLIIQSQMTRKKNNSSKTTAVPRTTQNLNKRPKRKSRKSKMNSYELGYKSVTSQNPLAQAPGVSNGRISRSQPFRMAKMSSAMTRITPAGMSFLKCAFAPPDFSGSDVKGVPDMFQGKSLIKKHRYIGGLNVPASADTYILLLPVPGYAYFQVTWPSGTPLASVAAFTGTPYSDFNTVFNSAGVAGDNTADLVNRFRYVSNHFELIPTTNAMAWTGNIQCFKFNLSAGIRQSLTANATNILSVMGLQSLNATNADQYTGPFNLGVYTGAYNTGNGFNFNNIIEKAINVPSIISAGDFGQLICGGGFPGLDSNFDCVCIKISGVGTNTANTCILKTWACVEYLAQPGSSVYEYQTFSCVDPVAMEMYRAIIKELPVGVSFLDNEGFWSRVLSIIKRVSGAASVLPGPYGAIASGVNMTTTALESLFI